MAKLLVKFHSHIKQADRDKLHKKHKGKKVRNERLARIGWEVIDVPDAEKLKAHKAYHDDDMVSQVDLSDRKVCPLRVIPNDPRCTSALTGQFNLFGYFNAPAMWDTATGSPSITVASIDTGVDYQHQDLSGRVIPLTGNCFWLRDASGNPTTTSSDVWAPGGHGTMGASLFASSTNDGIGMAGIDWGSRLISANYCDPPGWASALDTVESVMWCVDNGATVVNCSWGDFQIPCNIIMDAFEWAATQGVLFSVSAGNSSDFRYDYPSSMPETVSVGAASNNPVPELCSYSTRGYQVDIIAPGGGSSIPPYTNKIWMASAGSTGTYGWAAGTSFAAPHITGLMSVLKAHYPSATNREIMARVFAGGHSETWSRRSGWGHVDCAVALSAAIEPAPLAPKSACVQYAGTSAVVSWPTSTNASGTPIYRVYRNIPPNYFLTSSTRCRYLAYTTTGTSFTDIGLAYDMANGSIDYQYRGMPQTHAWGWPGNPDPYQTSGCVYFRYQDSLNYYAFVGFVMNAFEWETFELYKVENGVATQIGGKVWLDHMPNRQQSGQNPGEEWYTSARIEASGSSIQLYAATEYNPGLRLIGSFSDSTFTSGQWHFGLGAELLGMTGTPSGGAMGVIRPNYTVYTVTKRGGWSSAAASAVEGLPYDFSLTFPTGVVELPSASERSSHMGVDSASLVAKIKLTSAAVSDNVSSLIADTATIGSSSKTLPTATETVVVGDSAALAGRTALPVGTETVIVGDSASIRTGNTLDYDFRLTYVSSQKRGANAKLLGNLNPSMTGGLA